MNNLANNSRRRFIKLAVVGLTAVPFTNFLSKNAVAGPVETISESDPLALAMKYKADATQATERKDTTATCANCTFYSGKSAESSGPCSIFQGKLVSANGWCTAWSKRL